jgi:hypothetical protein
MFVKICQFVIRTVQYFIRNLISGRGSRVYRNFTFERILPIQTLWQQLDIEIDDPLIACSMMVWCTKEVDTDFRQFAFRWYQGMVHGNTVISHFGDVDRKCTFCKIKAISSRTRELGRELTQAEIDGIDVRDEDRPHIYWNCETVNLCITEVYRNFWGRNIVVDKKEFLLGKNLGIMEATVLYMLLNMYIKYKIWKFKLAGVLPRAQCISNDVNDLVSKLSLSSKWRNMLPLLRQHMNAL